MAVPLLLVTLPLLAAFLLPVVQRLSGPAARILGPLVLTANVALALPLWEGLAEGPRVFAMGGFAAPLGIVLYLDPIALILVTAVSVAALFLWPRGLYAPLREAQLTLLLATGGIGLALSGDLFNLFVFFQLVAVASYGLGATWGSAAGYAAALRYLLLSALGSTLALLGIALIYVQTGSLNLAHLGELAPAALNGPAGLTAFALILAGLGVQAQLVPFNGWVPEVSANAPSRVAGLLAGAVSKLALLAVVRLMVLAYAGTSAPLLLLAAGALGVIYGELAALRAMGLRRVLGYASIGQLGMVTIAFAIPGEAGMVAGLALALHHLLVKPALFLFTHAWGGPLARLEGGAKASPWGAGLFALFALSLVGIPPLPGFWAKLLLFKAALADGGGEYCLAAALVALATLVEAAYLLRILRRLYRRGEPQIEPPAPREMLPILVLGGLLALATLQATPLAAGLERAAARGADRAGYIDAVLRGSGP